MLGITNIKFLKISNFLKKIDLYNDDFMLYLVLVKIVIK